MTIAFIALIIFLTVGSVQTINRSSTSIQEKEAQRTNIPLQIKIYKAFKKIYKKKLYEMQDVTYQNVVELYKQANIPLPDNSKKPTIHDLILQETERSMWKKGYTFAINWQSSLWQSHAEKNDELQKDRIKHPWMY